ncbi:MAG: EamA family transporter [Chloroflexi bacterium]|nr:EamA family transporter [Chloroflexota bacterium]
MSLLALALILAAAFMHAGWNLLAKRAGGGAAFVWLFGAVSTALYAPLAVVAMAVQRPHVGAAEALFLAGSGALHTVYFLSLQQGYRAGDLSLVYPLARGTGPLLATIAAIVVLGERPSPPALAGAALIALGVFALAASPRATQRGSAGAAAATRPAVLYGLRTGALIATYTLWDKHAVSALLLPPLLLDWTANAGRTLLLTPVARARAAEVRAMWRARRTEVLGVAVLAPLAYILVLTAMSFTPVSYVAPAREIAILIGAAMGARLLAEGDSLRRLAAAGAMVVGIVALTLG